MKHVVVGNGVTGVTAAQSIVRADPTAEVHTFGADSYPYYRRPLLWEFIAGEIERDALYFRPPAWYVERGIYPHLGIEVTVIDPTAHSLALADGSQVEYDRLLLATGCRPFVSPWKARIKRHVTQLIEQGADVSAHANHLLDDDFDLKSLLQTEPQA